MQVSEGFQPPVWVIAAARFIRCALAAAHAGGSVGRPRPSDPTGAKRDHPPVGRGGLAAPRLPLRARGCCQVIRCALGSRPCGRISGSAEAVRPYRRETRTSRAAGRAGWPRRAQGRIPVIFQTIFLARWVGLVGSPAHRSAIFFHESRNLPTASPNKRYFH